MSGEIVIVTGAPGAGKTTVTRLLATEAERPTVRIQMDDWFHAIGTGFVPPYLPESHRQNEVVVDAVVASVRAFAEGGYDVVVDGIVGPWFLPPFRGLAGPVTYIVLRPDLPTTVARAQARSERELRDADPITRLYAQFGDLGELEPHALDTTGQDPPATAQAVREIVRAGTHRIHRS